MDAVEDSQVMTESDRVTAENQPPLCPKDSRTSNEGSLFGLEP